MSLLKRLRLAEIWDPGEKPFDLETWRNSFTRAMTFIAILVFPLAMVTTLPVLLAGGHYGLLILDLLAFLILIFLFLLKRDNLYFSRIASLIVLYVLTISFFIALGPTHARAGWLVMCALVGVLSFGFRGAILCTGINAALLLVVYMLADPRSTAWQSEMTAPFGHWMMFVVNISGITLFCSLAVGGVLRSLGLSLKSEQRSGEVLKKAYINLKDEVENRRHAEKALRQSEVTYRSLVENIGIGVSMVDPDMKILALNKKMKQWFPKVDTEKKPICYHVLNDPPLQDICPDCPAKKTFVDGRIHDVIKETGSNGNHRTLRIISSPITNGNGEISKVIEMVEDITEKEKAKENLKMLEGQLRQAQKMEAMGTMAGGIAHEFNNVLGIIMGNAELSMDDIPAWSPAKENLNEIQKASLRARDVVQQILSFARKSMTDRKPVEIAPIIHDSLKLMRASIPTMIEIKLSIQCKSEMILGDPTEIHQILFNLCGNAAHAMKSGEGLLEVTLGKVELSKADGNLELEAGNYIKLRVKDNGHGMSEDVLERVFDPFFTTKEVGEGTGMGLAVVHGIVKKYGGTVGVQSWVGKGTVVEVLIPSVDGEPFLDNLKNEELPTGEERILFVDDEESMVRMGKQILERLGYQVTEMKDSTKALECFRSAPEAFDLVITDMAMPQMAGDQLASELIAIRADIPILLCTGHSDRMDADKARKAGFKGFAMKPLNRSELARSVRSVLD